MSLATTANRPEQFTFHPLDTLQAMSLAELEALWELVPTDRQRLYKAIYDRTRRDEGASGSDTLENKMVEQLIARYAQKGLVPVGSYWVPTPPQLQAAATTNNEVNPAEREVLLKSNRPSLLIILVGGLCLAVFGLIFLRGSSSTKQVTTTNTVTPTPTATLLRTYTPTPLALDAQDSIIRGSDAGGSNVLLYPVNLRIVTASEGQPRIFVVQRRAILTTEWNYEDNPDTASLINGLTIRPVLGVPWSESNAQLFDQLQPGSLFILQMNTGAMLRFQFATKYVVNRSDTSAFQQNSPGLVLTLIGERDSDTKEATPNRMMVLADYLSDQELARGAITGISLPKVDLPTPTVTPTPLKRMEVEVISVASIPGQVQIHLRIFNAGVTHATLDARSIWLAYGYSEHPIGPHVAAALQSILVEAGQALDLSLIFAWHGEPFATLGILDDFQYSLTFKQDVHDGR